MASVCLADTQLATKPPLQNPALVMHLLHKTECKLSNAASVPVAFGPAQKATYISLASVQKFLHTHFLLFICFIPLPCTLYHLSYTALVQMVTWLQTIYLGSKLADLGLFFPANPSSTPPLQTQARGTHTQVTARHPKGNRTQKIN